MNLNLKPSHSGYMVKEKDNSLIYRPHGSGDYLFLFFPVGMYLTAAGQEVLLRKHACIFYAPQDYQRFHGCPAFVNSYVHFTAEKDYMDGLDIPFGQPFYPGNYEILNHLVLEIQREHISSSAHSDMLSALALQKLLLLSSRHFAAQCGAELANNTVRQQMEQLRLEMLTNYTYPWTMQELADRAAMSRSRFYACYKDFFGAAPKAELLETRMAEARLILTNKAITVQEAALKCGFENLSHFTRYYKKYYGVPPRGGMRER